MIFDVNTLLNNFWILRDGHGSIYNPNLGFHKNGKIINSLHDNEYYWSYVDGTLSISSKNCFVTSLYKEFYYLGDGFYQICGEFQLEDGLGDLLVLESIPLDPLAFNRVAIEASISGKSNKLIIQINSAGALFDGNAHVREFNKLLTKAGQDTVRVSQGPVNFWYTNKVIEIENILSSFISLNYNEVFIIGSSAGGYFSILVGEFLAARHRNIHFTTFSINPKTTFNIEHLHYLTKKYDQHYFSSDIMDVERLSKRSLVTTDLSEYISLSRSNIQHEIMYDQLNPVENYHTNLISKYDRVRVHGFNLNLGHGEGCVAIGDSDYFVNFFLKRVNLKLDHLP